MGPVQYDFWRRAKTAFDEDDSVTSPGDFKKFFMVQAEVYVQEELIPFMEARAHTHTHLHMHSTIIATFSAWDMIACLCALHDLVAIITLQCV